jgi:hypothetical protein
MSDWGRSGGERIPHDEAATKEHFKEVADDIRQEREAERFEKAHRTRPWWKFWAKPSG